MIGVCLIVIVAVGGLGALFLQDEPALAASPPPAPQDVAATRELVRDIRAAADSGPQGGLLKTDIIQLNSAIRLGTRFISGFRGRVTVVEDEVLGEVSVPIRWWSGRKWLNVAGWVPAFDGQVAARKITVGGTDLPARLVLTTARIGANLVLGNKFGDRVIEMVTAMTPNDNDGLTFRIVLDDVGKNGVLRSAFGSLRGAQMPNPEEIEDYHQLIRTAMASGQLSETGSFLPYIQFTLRAALDNSTPETFKNAYTAALLGLTKVCGARDFAMIVGSLVFDVSDSEQEQTTSCSEVTFNNRIDSRRHFITSAALQAASNTGVSVSFCEFKELYDSISGAGGFDFTDMAANLSGIRMSNVFMATPLEDWPILLSLLQAENDVIVPFDGIPQIMSEDDFNARFTDVDSPAYRNMLAIIEARIDQLDLYRFR